jgi:type I restriction enzyme S subunit
MSWCEINLGDAVHVKHGFAFKGQYFSDSGEYVVLTPGNFNEEGGFRLRPGKDRFYAGDIPEDYVLDEGDLMVAMTEQGPGLLGSSALIPEGEKYLHNQRLGLIQDLDGTVLDKRFLYYLFNTRTVRGQISGSASGTKVRHTAPERIYRVKVTVPSDVTEQKEIASILSAYDDLIENNQRRIQLLEQAARLLYKEWFVHLRFPGHEHTKIQNGIPEGWEKKKINDVCETVGGGTPSTKVSEYWDGDITWVVPSDITKNDCLALLNSEQKITEKGLRKSSAKMVPAETILMTSRASVGFFALMDYEVCTNQGFINIIPYENEMRMYLLFNLMSRVEEIRSNAKGTTYPEISKGRFRDMGVVVPPKTFVNEFAEFASDIIRQVRILKRSTLKLAKARDILLPRLMNGEVEV